MKIENDLCRSCFGAGKWHGDYCSSCNGTGIASNVVYRRWAIVGYLTFLAAIIAILFTVW